MSDNLDHIYSHCYFCESRLTVGAVPLFAPSRNKEFLEKIAGQSESFILSDCISSVGIDIGSAATPPQQSLCKKCARKIVNCCTLFQEIKQLFFAKNILNLPEQVESGASKRVHSNSPSGLTPSSKKTKQFPQEKSSVPKGKSKKTLFELDCAWSERERVDDDIANLMSLPVTEDRSSSSVVKVSF